MFRTGHDAQTACLTGIRTRGMRGLLAVDPQLEPIQCRQRPVLCLGDWPDLEYVIRANLRTIRFALAAPAIDHRNEACGRCLTQLTRALGVRSSTLGFFWVFARRRHDSRVTVARRATPCAHNRSAERVLNISSSRRARRAQPK
jgi:hypothetical protein